MTDVYPRIETRNVAPANPPRRVDVVEGKVLQSVHFSSCSRK